MSVKASKLSWDIVFPDNHSSYAKKTFIFHLIVRASKEKIADYFLNSDEKK